MSQPTQLRGLLSTCALPLLAYLVVLVGCQESSEPKNTSAAVSQVSSPIQIYFTYPSLAHTDSRHPAQVIARYIECTQQSLDVCAHELDNAVITKAILDAQKRGVCVRVVTESVYLREPSIIALKNAGIPIVDDRREGALMHNKFIIFDNQAVWTGSMNFTDNCTSGNDNHGLYIADERIAANYATKFRWMFEKGQFGNAPGKQERIPYPEVRLSDGALVENYFAPHDRVAEKIIARIRQAHSSIHFLVFSFTHRGIAEALLERAKNGVEIIGVLERRQAIAAHSMYSELSAYGPPVHVYLDGNKYNMHHKLLILDGKMSIAGSFNWSVTADKDNDENILIVHSPTVAEQFEREFQRVLRQAQAAQKNY